MQHTTLKAPLCLSLQSNFLEIPKYQKDAERTIQVVDPEDREEYTSKASNAFQSNSKRI